MPGQRHNCALKGACFSPLNFLKQTLYGPSIGYAPPRGKQGFLTPRDRRAVTQLCARALCSHPCREAAPPNISPERTQSLAPGGAFSQIKALTKLPE